MSLIKKSKVLPLVLLGLSFLGGAGAQNLDKKLSGLMPITSPRFEFNVNLEAGTKPKEAEYSLSCVSLSPFDNPLTWDLKNIAVSSEEKSQIEKTITSVKSREINSYSDFVNSSKPLSENSKVVLLASTRDLISSWNYDASLTNVPVLPQESAFYNFQNSLNEQKKIFSVACGQESSYMEGFSNDLGIRTSATTVRNSDGSGHVINILKLSDGTAILGGADSDWNLILLKTRNIEKVIESYQKAAGKIEFQHLFFEDNRFKYRLINQNGRNFLEFVDYDSSSAPIKKSLIERIDITPNCFTFNFEGKNYLTSFEIDYSGFFIKAGDLKGNIYSDGKMGLFKTGFNKELSGNNFKIKPDVCFVATDDGSFGFFGDLTGGTNNEKGLNLSSRIALSRFIDNNYYLFYDYLAGLGVSYRALISNLSLTPYSSVQFKLFAKDLGERKMIPTFDEVEAGLKLGIPFLEGSRFSFNPFYIRELGEEKIGASAELKTSHFGINAGGSFSNPLYDFCLKRYGADFGISALLGKLDLKLEGKLNETNYDGEKESASSLSLTGKVNF